MSIISLPVKFLNSMSVFHVEFAVSFLDVTFRIRDKASKNMNLISFIKHTHWPQMTAYTRQWKTSLLRKGKISYITGVELNC